MRKIVSMLLVVSFLLFALASCGVLEGEQPTEAPKATEGPTDTQAPEATDPPSSGDDEKEEDENESVSFVPVVRFAVASDMHVTTADGEQARRTTAMINQMHAYAKTNADGYGKLDAFFFAGDLTDNGKVEEFEIVNNIFKTNIEEGTELILATGNHDSWSTKDANGGQPGFFKVFGENSSMRDEVIGGYHVLSIYGDGNNTGSDYTQKMCDELEKRIKAAIADTGANKPVFVVQHVGELNTVVGTDSYTHERSYAATDALYEMKSKYPNLIVFSGHIHFPNNDECSIWQGDFTEINTGTLYYALQSMKNGTEIPIENRYDLAQCYVVEVDSIGRTRVRCWDVLQEKFVGEEWMIDSYDPREFKYTVDRFSKDDIFFAEDAEIKLSISTGFLTRINFPPVPEESLAGRVYEVKLYKKGGELVSTQYVGDDYFKDIFDRRISASFSGLVDGNEYTVTVVALNSLYITEIGTSATLRSDPLTLDFTVGQTTDDGGDIIDISIDAANNKITNQSSSGLALNVKGTLHTAHDSSINKDIVVFDGTENGIVSSGSYLSYDGYLEESVTIETYLKIDERPGSGKYVVPVGALQGGGFGLEAFGPNNNNKYGRDLSNKIAFFVHNGSEYLCLAFDYDVGIYYHVVATYDGDYFKLYVDGNLVESMALSSISFPDVSTNAHKVYLGVDVCYGGGNEPNAMAKCSIAEFKLYIKALTAQQVAEAYEAIK